MLEEDLYGLWQLTIEFFNDTCSWTKLIGTQEQVSKQADEMVQSLDLMYIVGYSLEELLLVPIKPHLQYASIENQDSNTN